MLHEYAQGHNVQLKTILGSQLPRVFGDRIQIQQVVLNLLLNGIDAAHRTPRNGKPEVIVTRNR
jgi:signal transduction histidine kinase